MARIIDYRQVHARLSADGLRCLYHNSGAFGFPPEAAVHTTAWIGPDDPTIRPAALPLVRRVPPPYESNLSSMFVKLWTESLPGVIWIMPRSHWAYELEFGSASWMPQALLDAGIDPKDLQVRNDGSSVEFSSDESTIVTPFIARLLEHLGGSDFTIAFPGRPIICTLHHHKQLWLQTPDENLAGYIEQRSPRR